MTALASSISTCKSLHTLDLRSNHPFFKSCLTPSPLLESTPKTTSWHWRCHFFSENRFGDIGIIALANSLPNLPFLSHLYLHGENCPCFTSHLMNLLQSQRWAMREWLLFPTHFLVLLFIPLPWVVSLTTFWSLPFDVHWLAQAIGSQVLEHMHSPKPFLAPCFSKSSFLMVTHIHSFTPWIASDNTPHCSGKYVGESGASAVLTAAMFCPSITAITINCEFLSSSLTLIHMNSAATGPVGSHVTVPIISTLLCRCPDLQSLTISGEGMTESLVTRLSEAVRACPWFSSLTLLPPTRNGYQCQFESFNFIHSFQLTCYYCQGIYWPNRRATTSSSLLLTQMRCKVYTFFEPRLDWFIDP